MDTVIARAFTAVPFSTAALVAYACCVAEGNADRREERGEQAEAMTACHGRGPRRGEAASAGLPLCHGGPVSVGAVGWVPARLLRGLRSRWRAETQERGAVLERTADPAKALAATIAFQKLVISIFS